MKVITPNCRVQFTAEDIEFISEVLAKKRDHGPLIQELLSDERSRDLILDDEALFQALLDARLCLKISTHFYFYILVRNALRRAGIESREVADYVAEVLSEYSREDRRHLKAPSDGRPLDYFFEMLSALQGADDRSRFVIRAHMGNESLFMTGVFPDRIRRRAERRGYPDLTYFESLGRSSFKEASHHQLAERYHLSSVFETLGEQFQLARAALNDLADRVFSLTDSHASVDAILRHLDSPRGLA